MLNLNRFNVFLHRWYVCANYYYEKINLFSLVALFHHHLLLFFGQLLFGDLLFAGFSLFGDSFFTFGQDHFDVAWVAHERIDSTVGSVGSSSVLWGFVDGDVFDEKRINIERFKLGVGFSVSEKFQKVFATLFWPSTLAGSHTWSGGKLFSLGASADTSVESDERNASFVFDDVFKVFLGFSQVHTFKHFGRFSGVLEVDSDIFASGFATFGRVAGLGHVPSHIFRC